ncbi:putative cell surface protein [Mucinivorans hirudinis]|uniref:Putative cell surface protein n=1 Tax=Mucinivorans hirudinis TaxID=1433126 RepID=A0A060RDI0_9BACT|nr:putative cell surface protein [Mucinivorans hirudinis]
MKKVLICATLVAMAFIGCKNRTTAPPQEPTDKRVAAQFTTGNVITRVADDAWEVGDKIGIFMSKNGHDEVTDRLENIVDGVENYPYEIASSGLSSGSAKFSPSGFQKKEIFFPTDGSSVDFFAYHPYSSDLEGHTLDVDISNQSSQTKLDLMWAKKDNHSMAAADVKLEFTRSLAKVEVKLAPGDGFTQDALKDAKVTIEGVPTKASASIFDGKISSLSTTDKVALVKKGEYGFEGILIPHTALAYNNRQISIELANGVKVNSPISEDIVAAKRRTYTVKVDKRATKFSMEITKWVDDDPIDLSTK